MGWAWFLVNVVLPIIIPPLGVLYISSATSPTIQAATKANFDLMNLFKNGQMAWIAAGMCAAAIFEVVEAASTYQENGKFFPLGWFAIFFPIFVSLVGAMIIAAQGSIYEVEPFTGEFKMKKWISHYQNFVSSVGITIASAITLMTVHLWVVPSGRYIFGDFQ